MSMDIEASYRGWHESQDFHSASLQLAKTTGFDATYTKSSPDDDMNHAIDIWFHGYGIAVRGRTFTRIEFAKYGSEITIRAKELPKIVNGTCTAIIYQCYDKNREHLGHVIISCNAIRRWFQKNNINVNDHTWHLRFKDSVTLIHPPEQNAFYAFNLKKLIDWTLYKETNKR